MLAKFTLYDVIAILIPGIFTIWGLNFLFKPLTYSQIFPGIGGGGNSIVFLSISYVAGLLLQGLSQGVTEKIFLWKWGGFPSSRWLFQDNSELSSEYRKQLKSKIEEYFKIKLDFNPTESHEVQTKKYQEAFSLCYNFVESQKLSDRPMIFNSQYGLFRGLTTSFIILSIVGIITILPSIISLGLSIIPLKTYLIEGLFAFGAVFSYLRAKKRSNDFAKSVYDLFFVHSPQSRYKHQRIKRK